MNEFQKIIKYLAMGFGIFLTFIIITGIVSAVIGLSGVFSSGSSVNTTNITERYDNVKSIEIDHGVGKLYILEGTEDQVVVEGSNIPEDYIIEKNFSGTLKIKNKVNVFNIVGINNNNKSTIRVYLPEGFVAEKFEINAGAGNVELNDITAKQLEIDAGAGNITGNRIYADFFDLDGGVGNIELKDIEFLGSDIDCGVGNIELSGNLLGKNKLECGVGEISIDLYGSPDDYKLTVEKGLGNIKVNGEKYSNVSWNNITATNSLSISGGLGNIDINFQK